MPVDCSVLAKGLAGGEDKKACEVCWGWQGWGGVRTISGRGREGHFLYDAVDFCDVFLFNLYILKSPHLVLPYFGFSLWMYHFNGSEISGSRKRPRREVGSLCLSTLATGKVKETHSARKPQTISQICALLHPTSHFLSPKRGLTIS